MIFSLSSVTANLVELFYEAGTWFVFAVFNFMFSTLTTIIIVTAIFCFVTYDVILFTLINKHLVTRCRMVDTRVHSFLCRPPLLLRTRNYVIFGAAVD